MTCDYCSAPILDAALACPACASKIAAAAQLSVWQKLLLEGIETAERVGLTDDSSEAALIVLHDGSALRLTLRQCREEYALTTETERPC